MADRLLQLPFEMPAHHETLGEKDQRLAPFDGFDTPGDGLDGGQDSPSLAFLDKGTHPLEGPLDANCNRQAGQFGTISLHHLSRRRQCLRRFRRNGGDTRIGHRFVGPGGIRPQRPLVGGSRTPGPL